MIRQHAGTRHEAPGPWRGGAEGATWRSRSTEGGIRIPSWKTGVTNPICAAGLFGESVSVCAKPALAVSV